MRFIELISLVLIIVTITLAVLGAAQIITWRTFWVITLLIGAFAYWGLPKMQE